MESVELEEKKEQQPPHVSLSPSQPSILVSGCPGWHQHAQRQTAQTGQESQTFAVQA